MSGAVPRVCELDLSCSLLSSWQEVLKLSRELPGLELLDVSRNEIAWPSDLRGLRDLAPSSSSSPPPPPPSPIFANLRSLILNACFVDWDTVVAIAGEIPGLRELHVAGNRIKSLACSSSSAGAGDRITSCLGKVEALHLEDNFIQDWAEVTRLKHLPCLQKLNLSGNLLDGVEKYDSGDNKPGFASLTTLFLQGNALARWADIDSLNHFESLSEIRVSAMPVFDGVDAITARMGVVARLPRLRRLNGSTVTQKERTDAEIGYLTAILGEAVGKEVKGIAEEHPRFPELMKSYGNVNLSAVGSSAAQTDRTTISKTLLSLQVASVASLETAETPLKSVKKKVPSHLTLAKFKILCQRLLGIAAGSQAVYVKKTDEEPPTEPEELLHDEDTLQQLGVCDGQSILVIEA